jgi:hypothetical protein
MRVGIVRSDIQKIFLNDIESRSQRCYSKEPPGQTRYLHKPSDAELLAVLNAYANLTIRGADVAAAVATDAVATDNKINFRTSPTGTFVQIAVTVGGAVLKTQIVTDLNAGFATASLPLVARISGVNRITIDTTTKGPGAYVEISAALPAAGTLHTILGLAAVATTGLSVTNLKLAVYPTAVTINVAPATINALSTFSLMTTAAQTALDVAIADVVAPRFVETGMALLSFAYGNLSKMRVATFWPGGAHWGHPAGICAAIVEDDGSTVFSL